MKVHAMLALKGNKVLTVRGDATIKTAVGILQSEKIGASIVSTDGTKVQGIFSERDIVRGLVAHGASLLEKRVADFMTADVKTCSLGDDIQDIMSQMTRSHIRHLPAVENGVLRSIISIGDVVKNRLEELETEANALRDYVAGRV